ncbi:MAG: copper resistance protein CopC [Hyphomicrobiales bacterium]
MKYLIVAALFTLSAVPASAHSKANKMKPANGSVISTVPSEVSLTFVKEIRLTKVSMTHAGKHSEELDLGNQKAFSKAYSVPMKDLGGGSYVIEWRGLGVDGHAMNGSFSFDVE